MINYIKGTLLEIESETCTVFTPSGVGYLLYIPSVVQERLPNLGEDIEFYVRTVLKEDSIDLYGFTNKEDRGMFNTLVSVSKLGPKTALAMLSTFDSGSLRDIVLREDYNTLTRVSGIGPKSAKRLVWELKDKLGDQKSTALGTEVGHSSRTSGTVYSDALSALLNLGYAEGEVKPVLSGLLQEFPDLMVEEAIKGVLKEMNREK